VNQDGRTVSLETVGQLVGELVGEVEGKSDGSPDVGGSNALGAAAGYSVVSGSAVNKELGEIVGLSEAAVDGGSDELIALGAAVVSASSLCPTDGAVLGIKVGE
jgi:hypothetical protein